MAEPTVMTYSRTYPVEVERAFDLVLPVPLEQIFDRRYGPIAPIRGAEDQDGVWGTVGQTRRVRLADGGSMAEELVEVDRPRAFAYVLGGMTGPLKALVSRVEGRWAFEPAGTGVRITWQWTVYPTSGLTRPALRVLARLWHGFARQGFERIENLLLAA